MRQLDVRCRVGKVCRSYSSASCLEGDGAAHPDRTSRVVLRRRACNHRSRILQLTVDFWHMLLVNDDDDVCFSLAFFVQLYFFYF